MSQSRNSVVRDPDGRQRAPWYDLNSGGGHIRAPRRSDGIPVEFSADESSDSSNPFFRNAAGTIIARLLHAASLADRPIQDDLAWARELERSTEARDILGSEPNAQIMWGRTLEAAVQGADETLSSVRMTLAQRVEPLLSRKVLRQMTATPPGVLVFYPTAFVPSTDTLVLIADDQTDTKVAPLSTMLLDECSPPPNGLQRRPRAAGWIHRCGSSATKSVTSHPCRNCPA